MKQLLNNIYFSFPVQLFILHFRKYQILLLFWYVLTSTIASDFMKNYGADALFFAPEYLGSVNMLGAIFTGVALGAFIMSWNITTFVLHSRRFKFLATTTNPFLKYCINNAILPVLFLLFYFVRLYLFDDFRELMNVGEIFVEIGGILFGLLLLLGLSILYFIGAERTIVRTMAPIISNPELFNKKFSRTQRQGEFGLRVGYFISGKLKWKKARSVAHYRQDFLDTVFKRHHGAAMASILLAFVFLVTVGFLLENKYFEMPAAASILIFFAVMTAFIGALSYFLESWSLPVAFVLIFVINFLYQKEIIDPRNKAYGLNYNNKKERPVYDKESLKLLCSNEKQEADKANMLKVLNNWKAKQKEDKPVMVFINVSGGGLRSAAFVMNALQQLDKNTNGNLMNHTFLISGASGGMLAASYYRELCREKLNNPSLDISNSVYTDDIAGDLLNPIFTSMVARDIFAPAQKFEVDGNKYIKDRGYAFEKKLADNTSGLLNRQLKDIYPDEYKARVPLIIFNSVIKSDGRKMMISTQPLSFMMKPAVVATDSSANPDAVDFCSLFRNQSPMNLRMLTALRMNATFPYVLPNVWLPSEPVIDVMDAGLRDNYGQETTLRFLDVFSEWIKANTSKVVILQLRDRNNDNWQQPYETRSVSDMIVTPATMLQHNWYKLQDYFQADQYSYFKESDSNIIRLPIIYKPGTPDKGAALNFHLTAREKRDVKLSFESEVNERAIAEIYRLLKN